MLISLANCIVGAHIVMLKNVVKTITADNTQRVSISKISIQRAKLKDLPDVYAIYFEAFKQQTMQGNLLFDVPEWRIEKLTLSKTIFIHLFHMLIERLIVASQQGSIFSLFKNNLDLIPFKVVTNDKIVGFFFLKRYNSRVFEVGLIGVLESKRGLGIGSQIMDLIAQRAKKMGACRLIVRASGLKQVKAFFTKCGFKQSFSEDVFFLDVA